ncbi:hypothetical protein EYF80_009392 [Liparis tanakae]|uniref:Uncharacterized protein n=1 Tax=Liparis tanakae TaxID=230148 RepID=A0A4Z2IRY7_9TELE|nr:hypothetical protein EYF80_009392 [Liparis tanakae]
MDPTPLAHHPSPKETGGSKQLLNQPKIIIIIIIIIIKSGVSVVSQCGQETQSVLRYVLQNKRHPGAINPTAPGFHKASWPIR